MRISAESIYGRGGILTGIEINKQVEEGNIRISPYTIDQLNPNSYNLRLGNTLKVYKYEDCIDSHKENETEEIIIPEEGIVLQPNKLYLGRTAEIVGTDCFIPTINGRSSGGRLGMSIHVCAGFGDIGFEGSWTLEIVVTEPLRVYAGDEIAQVCFTTPYGDPSYLYRGRYYKQEDPTASKFAKDKDKSSMAHDALHNYERKRLIHKLYNRYGDFEFSSHGFYIDTMDISTSLYNGEIIEGTKIMVKETNECIGKVYDVGGEKIYVRRG